MSRSCLLLLMVLASLAWAGEPGVVRSDGGGGVLVLGDSLSAAYGLEQEAGWVALLARDLEHRCPGLKVHNASVSGETTAGGLLRLPALLEQKRPRLVVIELGGNDGLRGLSPQRMAENLSRMIKLAQVAGAEVVLFGIVLPPNFGDAYRQLFTTALDGVAGQQGVPYLDFFLRGVGGRVELMQDDGLHPNAEAQARLLANAREVLDPLLARHCR